MGSSKPDSVQKAPVALTGDFGGVTQEIPCAQFDTVGVLVVLDAGVSVNAIELKPQTPDADGNWVDIYRDSGGGDMTVNTISVPVTADTDGQQRFFRVDTRGVNGFRLNGRVLVGSVGSIADVQIVADGSNTKTPNIGA